MIYEDSTDRKFIFIHNPRTGGVNLTDFFYKFTNGKKYISPQLEMYQMHLIADRCDLKFSNYYPFGFIRNPFDREYSFYTLFKTREPDSFPTFKDWIIKQFYIEPGHRYYGTHGYLKPQCYYFNDHVNVFRFENRKEALAEIAVNINVDVDTLVNYRGKVNTYKPHPIDYRTMYDQEMIDIVYPYFREDLEKYGYSFE